MNATEYLGDACDGLTSCTAAFNEGTVFTNAPDVCTPKTREYATLDRVVNPLAGLRKSEFKWPGSRKSETKTAWSEKIYDLPILI